MTEKESSESYKRWLNSEIDRIMGPHEKRGNKMHSHFDDPTIRQEKSYKRICKNCGLTWGSHRGDTEHQCPGHEGLSDWDESPGTYFEYSGRCENIPYGTPATLRRKNGRMLRLK